MSRRKRTGYNWKARQQNVKASSWGVQGIQVELDESLRENESGRSLLDTNQQVLPSKGGNKCSEKTCGDPKRRKLNLKQRKRLLKVIEAKERKAKVDTLNKAHHTCCIHAHRTWYLSTSVQLLCVICFQGFQDLN